MTVKSIFVPANLLRDEIRIGRGGAAPPAHGGDTDGDGDDDDDDFEVPGDYATDAPDDDSPADDPVGDDPVGDDAAEVADDDAGDDARDVDAAEEDVPATNAAEETEFAADPVTKEAPAPFPSDVASPVQVFPSLDDGDDAEDADDGDDGFGPARGGGVFGGDVAATLSEMLLSSNNATAANIMEDSVYELNAIRSYLDSIALSLKEIADKYCRDSSGKPRNTGRNGPERPKGPNNDRGNWQNGDRNKPPAVNDEADYDL